MIDTLLILLIGFSVISAAVLLVVYSVLYRNLNKSWLSIITASAMLLCFAVIQLMHLHYIQTSSDLFDSKYYSTLVLLTAPLFLFFVLEYVGDRIAFSPVMLLHVVPLALNLAIPNQWSLPMGFLVGTAYAAYCVMTLYPLRQVRARFQVELLSLGFFAAVAIALLLLGILVPLSSPHYFIYGYSLLISCSFLLVVASLLMYPELAINLNEALESKYAKSTLGNLDRQSMLAELDKLMKDDLLSRDETLSLATLAERTGYSSHQISELVNSELGYGVSRYIREHRIRDARQMLVDETEASILSISLATGFTSQSTFYAAFNQIVGMSPGNYRKSRLG